MSTVIGKKKLLTHRLNDVCLKPCVIVLVLGFLFFATARADTAATPGKSPDTLSLYVKPYSVQVFSASGKIVKPKEHVSVVVKVKDAQKKPVSNLHVRFSLELAPMEANGTELSSNEVVTDAKGEAKIVLFVGDRDGTYRISFSSEEGGVSSFFSVKAQSFGKTAKTDVAMGSFSFPVNDVAAIPPLPMLQAEDTGETIVEIKPVPAKKISVSPLPQNETEKIKKDKKNTKGVTIDAKQPIFDKENAVVKSMQEKEKVKAGDGLKENKKTQKQEMQKVSDSVLTEKKPEEKKPENPAKADTDKVKLEKKETEPLKGNDILLAEARVKLKLKALAGNAAKIIVKPEAVKIPADGKTQTKVIVRVFDAYGNAVADNTKVTVKASRGQVLLQDADADMQGLQAGTKAGSVEFLLAAPEDSGKSYVQAKVNDVKGEALVHFYGTLSYITLSPLSPGIVCGNTAIFNAAGFDKNSEPVAIVPAYRVEGNIGKIDAKSGKFVATKAGTGKIFAAANGFKGFTDVEVLPAKAAKIAAYTKPKLPVVNQNVTVIAKVFDEFGNIVPDTDVKFTLSQGKGQLSAQSGKASEDGNALTTVMLDNKVTYYKIIISHGDLQKSVAFKSLPGNIASLKVLPKNIEVRAGIPITFKTEGLDEFGNVIPVSPKFYAMGIGKVDQDKGIFISHKAGEGKVLVSVKQFSEIAIITVLPSKPVRIDVRSKQAQVTVGSETQVVATVYDSYGNPVPNVKLYFNVLGNGVKINAVEHVTDSNGKAEATLKVPTKVSDVVIEVVSPEVNSWLPDAQHTDTLVAQSGLFDAFPFGLPKKALFVASSGASLKIKIVSGEAKKMTLKAFPAKITADGKSTSVVSMEVFDEYGNLFDKEIPVTFETNAGKIITTDQNKSVPGVQILLKGGKAQITIASGRNVSDAVVSAGVSGLQEKVFLSFVPSAPSSMKIIPDVAQLTGDGTSTSKVTVKVVDKFGNGITGKNVRMSVDKGGLKIQPEESASKSVFVSLSGGVGFCYFTSPNGVGTATLNANMEGLTSQAKIAIVAGSLQQLQVIPDIKQIKAGEDIVFKVQGRDEFGNVLSISPLWGVVGEGSVDEYGKFTSLKPGKATVIARAGDIVGQSMITILPAAPDKFKVTPSLTEAATGQSVEIEAQLYDKFGNPVPEDIVSYQLVSQEGQLSSSEGITDKNGRTVVTLTLSPHTGLNIVKVKHKNKNVRAVQVFVKGLPGPAASISLRSSPPALSDTGYALITAQVMDGSGNLVEDGTSVTFTSSSGLFSTGSTQLTVPVIGGMASTKLLFDSSAEELVVSALAEGTPPSQLTLKRSKEPVVSITPKEEKKSIYPNLPNIPQLPSLTDMDSGNIIVKSKMPHIVQSIQCSGCDIRWLLTELSKKSGVNIAADGAVKGETTINLQNIPVEEALALIVRATGFTYEKIGESYLVSTEEKLKTLPQTEIISLKEAQAKDVETILKDIVKDVNVKVDKRTNSIIVTSPRNQLIELKRIIGDLDEPAPASAGIVVEVIHLEYADAELIKTILDGMNIGKEEGAELEIYNPSANLSSGVGGVGVGVTGVGGTAGTTGGTTTGTATTGTSTTSGTSGNTNSSGGISSGSATSSAPGNIIILKDTPYNIARAKAIIKGIDIQPKQVMIEARIEEVKTDALKKIGFQWPEQLGTAFTEKNQDLKSFSRPSIAISTTLKALETSGDAKTLSSPRIATVDGKTAFIHIGDNFFFKQPTVVVGTTTAGQVPVQTFEWKSIAVGIILNIIPRVTEDNYISINLVNTVSTADNPPQDAPPNTKQRTAQTFVRVKEGETITIGGLISNDEIESLSKVPVLSELPVLGSLFKNHSKQNTQSELVIFLTPYIMK